MNVEVQSVQLHIQRQMGEKARLTQLKTQVDDFEKQKAVLQQRINIIEELQRNRTGDQELLDALANQHRHPPPDTLWLTSLDRKGDGLTIQGTAGSIDAVANFITQLKQSGLHLRPGGDQGVGARHQECRWRADFYLCANSAVCPSADANPGAGANATTTAGQDR